MYAYELGMNNTESVLEGRALVARFELQALTKAAADLRTSGTVLVASLAWLVFDMLLTFKQEIRYLRRSPWTLSKILYVILRIHCVLSLAVAASVTTSYGNSPERCRGWLHWEALIGSAVPIYAGQALLLLRICSLYRDKPTIVKIAVGLYICHAVFLTTMDIFEVTAIRLPDRLPEGVVPLPGCWMAYNAGRWKRLQLAFGIYDVAVSTVYFLLTLCKFAETARRTTGRRWFGGAPVVLLFFRDACWFYLAITLSQVTQALFLSVPMFANGALAGVAFPITAATYSIATSRLIYSMRDKLTTGAECAEEGEAETQIQLTSFGGEMAFMQSTATAGYGHA